MNKLAIIEEKLEQALGHDVTMALDVIGMVDLVIKRLKKSEVANKNLRRELALLKQSTERVKDEW